MSKTQFKKYMVPMKLAFMYNIGTLALFLLSSWNYSVTNYASVIAVVFGCNLAMYLGYYYNTTKHFQGDTESLSLEQFEKDDNSKIVLLFRWTVIAAIFALPNMLYNSRTWTLSLTEIIKRLAIAFTKSNLNYSNTLNYVDSGSIIERIVVLIDVFIYFFRFAVLPLTVFFWNKVSKTQKFLCFYVTLMDVVKWLLKGMNKGIFDIAFVFLGAALLTVFANNISTYSYSNRVRRNTGNKKGKLIVVGIIAIVLAVVLFVANDRARSGGKKTSSYYSQSMGISADKNSLFMKITPAELHSAVLGIEMYLTNGYQGLSYALRLPFVWCYGIGNNQFLISNFRDAFGLDVSDLSYLRRIEKVFPWKEWHNWHSIYTWLANDTSFYFLPLLFFFWGWMFSASWIDSIEKHNHYAVVVYALFVIRIVYMPANNQVLSLSQSFIAWYMALFMWFLSRKGFRFIIS